jgi:hypothetical protein
MVKRKEPKINGGKYWMVHSTFSIQHSAFNITPA